MRFNKGFIKITFIVLGALTALPLQAQVTFSAGMGYATYAMSDLKKINNELLTDSPLDLHVTSSFPAYFAQDFTFGYKAGRTNFGLFLSFNSTGSRVSYQDYSGSVWYNQTVSSTQYGLYFGHNFIEQPGPWEVVGSLRFGIINTAHQMESHLQVTGSTPQTSSLDFISTSQMVSPGLALTRNLVPWLYASFDMRYVYDFRKDLKLKSNQSVPLVDNNNNPVSADWSGLRLTLSVGVRFIKATPP